ncbi:MAG: hypothetical protein ACLFR6_08320 [Salinarchaeum sp.]
MSDDLSVASITRADLLLMLIPLTFALISGAGTIALDSWIPSTAGASLACCVLIADGLFWHPPTDR